jgi:hypothetical protein
MGKITPNLNTKLSILPNTLILRNKGLTVVSVLNLCLNILIILKLYGKL